MDYKKKKNNDDDFVINYKYIETHNNKIQSTNNIHLTIQLDFSQIKEKKLVSIIYTLLIIYLFLLK